MENGVAVCKGGRKKMTTFLFYICGHIGNGNNDVYNVGSVSQGMKGVSVNQGLNNKSTTNLHIYIYVII